MAGVAAAMAGRLRPRTAAMVAVAVALAPAGAAEANSCTFNAAQKLLSIDAIQGSAAVARSGDTIAVFDSNYEDTTRTPLTCTGGTPTVTTVDTIEYTTAYAQFMELRIDLAGGRFAPGATDETGFSDEIEFEMTGSEFVRIYGTSGVDTIAAGSNGVNLNAAEGSGFFGADVDLTGAARVAILGGDGADSLTSAGGAATGDSHDYATLDGELGADTLTGGAFDDFINGGPGDDALDGGGDVDVVNFEGTPGVTVSLAAAGPQNTGGAGTDTLTGFERLAGSEGDDVLTGSAGKNLMSGGAGDDTLDGGAGDDEIYGGDGSDTVSYASVEAGGVDVAFGSPDSPAGAASGGGGADVLLQLENVIGSPLGDKLTGSDGPNVLTGGRGNDELSGLNGADVFHVQDGALDTVACGLDNDAVNADPMGVDSIAADCESVTFTDVTPPETALTAGPEGPSASASPTFSFSSDDPTATFECALDGAGFAACTSPTELSALPDGQHVFAVRARDPAGNVDPSPVERRFVVDTRPPDTAIARIVRAAGPRARFTFDSEPGATFQCGLDGGDFAPCATPYTAPRLADGRHKLAVRALDAAGNRDPTPATSPFRIGLPVLSKLRVGARIEFQLDRRARVRLTLERVAGRWSKLRGKRAVRARRGRTKLAFGGRWRGRPLRPGRYRVTAVPRNAVGKGKRRRAVFRIR